MAYYRLYFMERLTDQIEHFREFEAEDDTAAIVVSEGWRGKRAMELWSGRRKVKRWEPA